ncbi:MAG TPA: HTTM domain-containing protein [Polyangiaceae bacterium]|nr:HTTM domain-containing protein [Polyangiaceae bacterium]
MNEGAEARISGYEPQPVERIEFIRVLAPLAILGFLSSRFVHVAHWLTGVGFVTPDLGKHDYRQPLYIPPIPVWLAVVVAATTVVSGVATSLGYRTRVASGVFAALLAYLALADRLEAFTVNKLGTVVAIALFAAPSGARYGVDAFIREKRATESRRPTHVTWGNVRFFQVLVMLMYFSSGIAKMRGDWLTSSNVIWSHLHDSYQTGLTHWLAVSVPAAGWTFFQYATLIYEGGAPLWYGMRKTRLPALVVGLGMHGAIGLMFGPVIWFSLLMSVLVLGSFAPVAWLSRFLESAWKLTGAGAGEASSPSP